MIHLDEPFVLLMREDARLFCGQALMSVQECRSWVTQRNAFA